MLTYRSLWQRLAAAGIESREAQALARLALDELFGMTLTDIAGGAVERLAGEEARRLEAVMARLAAGEPAQYVLGAAWFCGRRFHVGPGVLVPRPETEDLVRMAEEALDGVEAPRIVDIGTGSGCIALTLALDRADADVEAWDVSPDALRVARGNADSLGATVAFARRDILAQASAATGPQEPRCHLVVSNPPYVMQAERASMDANVLQHEPSLALFVPDGDPLLFVRAIGAFAAEALLPGGRLLMEINPLLADDVAEWLRRRGFANVGLCQDRFGKQRFVTATQPN